ncbi:unnamed protein product [Ectocarpus sp. 12 AP-2014]
MGATTDTTDTSQTTYPFRATPPARSAPGRRMIQRGRPCKTSKAHAAPWPPPVALLLTGTHRNTPTTGYCCTSFEGKQENGSTFDPINIQDSKQHDPINSTSCSAGQRQRSRKKDRQLIHLPPPYHIHESKENGAEESAHFSHTMVVLPLFHFPAYATKRNNCQQETVVVLV